MGRWLLGVTLQPLRWDLYCPQGPPTLGSGHWEGFSVEVQPSLSCGALAWQWLRRQIPFPQLQGLDMLGWGQTPQEGTLACHGTACQPAPAQGPQLGHL